MEQTTVIKMLFYIMIKVAIKKP